MRLIELRLLNFRQHADTHVRFPAGLTGVIGPNGAGKSTLLEAIAWALYGAEATRGFFRSRGRLARTSRVQRQSDVRDLPRPAALCGAWI